MGNSFGRSECSRVKDLEYDNLNFKVGNSYLNNSLQKQTLSISTP